MRQQAVEILAAFVDDRRQADDLRAGADDDEKLELSVVLELCHIIVLFCFFGLRFPVKPGMTLLYRFEIGIRPIGVKELIRPHQGNERLGV